MSIPAKLERQICPICKRYVKYSSRYPNYVCGHCVQLATDKKGNPVFFFNTEFSGHGCAGAYVKIGKPYNSNLCYIKGVECKAEEAYLGGIVVKVSKKLG
jgi:hypothetical protein